MEAIENVIVGEEIVKETAEALVQNVPVDVVEETGMSLAKKAGVVGVAVVIVAAAAYGVVKFRKAKKNKNNVENVENASDNADSDGENEN